MRFIAALALLSVLAACGTTPLSNELKPYLGRNLRELVEHLGRPNGKLESSGDPVYVWLSDSEGVLPASPTSSATEEGRGSALMPVQYECRLEVAADAHDVIQHYEIQGSAIGCNKLRGLLKR